MSPSICVTNDKESGGTSTTKTPGKNPCGKTLAGEHPGSVVTEAANILRSEGYAVGRVINPDLPFDLMAWRDREVILFRVVRAKGPVRNAAEARREYEPVIRTMMPHWHSEADKLQLMIISRKTGVLRYNVFAGGIWNTKTREKLQNCLPKQENPCTYCAIRRTRTAGCPVPETGAAGAPVTTT